MKRYVFLVLCLLSLCVLPAQGQWYKRLGATLEHDLPSNLRGMTPAQAGMSHALEQTVRRAEVTQAVLQHPAQNAIFKIKEREWLFRFVSIQGTGFAIEEVYKGKKYVWGVTATHYGYGKPAIQLDDQHKPIKVPFIIQGSAGRNDVTLFPIPEDLVPALVPLHLAVRETQVGDNLSSVGYWNNKIHVDPVRTVKEINVHQFITSLYIEPTPVREGTCGSPVLNEQGEVVGMHVGNSPRQQVGYVVPVSHIRQALQAYHEGQFSQSLFFNGVEIGKIDINEYIDAIEMYREGLPMQRQSLTHRQKQVDYDHLESLLQNQPFVNRIVFVIERNPLTTLQSDKHFHMAQISYDLKTGQVSRSELQ